MRPKVLSLLTNPKILLGQRGEFPPFGNSERLRDIELEPKSRCVDSQNVMVVLSILLGITTSRFFLREEA